MAPADAECYARRMAQIGTVRELWRYPVKSMVGESLTSATIGPRGIPGDRGWAVRDERAGEIRGAKKLPALMQCRARYLGEPAIGAPPPVAEITLPDGRTVRADAPDAADALSALLDRPVTLWPLQPDDDLAHYRRGVPDDPDMMAELRAIFGREPDEPLPDLSVFPPELFEYTSPIGTYFDAFPVHLVTTSTLATFGDDRFDRRRFRPNVLVATDGRGFVERDWCGRRIRVGGAVIAVTVGTARCVMTTLETDGLPKDPSVLRSIVRDAEQNLGVYATVVEAGPVRVGDPIAFA
jgi:uncharacterized protein YcbX